MKHQINEISERFSSDIRLLETYLAEIKKSIIELNNECEKLKTYIEEGNSIEVKPKVIEKEDGKSVITRGICDNPQSREIILFALKNRTERLSEYIKLSVVMSFTYLMTTFDAKYLEIINTYFNGISDTFPSDVNIENKVMKFAYKSFDRQLRSLKMNHNIDFEKIFDRNKIEQLIEIIETRNIIVHNSGIVSKKYIKNVSNTKLTEGELRIVDEVYLENAKDLIQIFFSELINQINNCLQ